jgi:hypothetical protein
MYIRSSLLLAATALSACTATAPENESADAFLQTVSEYCGEAYSGTIVSTDPEDEDWRAVPIIADFAVCNEDELRIPLHVGDDHSRTWIVSRNADHSLHLSHQHNHEDGSPDALTMYGGSAAPDSTGERQIFPAGDDTKSLFDEQGIPVSKDNVWTMTVSPETNLFAYELSRPNRHFRVEFDLSAPVERPPPSW